MKEDWLKNPTNCKYCGELRKNRNSAINHQRFCKQNPSPDINPFSTPIRKGRPSWNKGLYGDERCKHSLETLQKLRIMGELRKGIPLHSEEFKKKQSIIAKQRGLGGHTSKRRIWYRDDIYLQSSFEIRLAKILDDLGIEWSRPDPFLYVTETGEHRYYPDFKVGNIYLDTKNEYLAIKDSIKIETVRQQTGADIRIVREHEITKEYVLAL